MTSLAAALAEDLRSLENAGLRRHRRVLETPQGAHVTVDGRDYIAFCSNDYLGLAAHPELVAAACEGAQRFGLGAGASHLILGHTSAHHTLEHALAQFVDLPAALFFSTGYMANLGVVTALASRGDAIFADKLNHASLNDAALLSRAQFKRYAHGDLSALEQLLNATTAKTKVIVSDAVFSMDGDLAPVAALLDLAQRHDAWLVLDDAHGFGVLGERGRGILEHTGLRAARIAYVGTLGKAAGVYGAFVAGECELIETLVQRARTYVYTTATPPLIAHALLKSLELIERAGERRTRLRALMTRLKHGLRECRWKLLPSDTPIQPLIIGDGRDALALAAQLTERGILVPAIRPPTVPQVSARLRISLSADHTHADVDALVRALLEVEAAS
ncbi:MAG: 8-amino-7-oxononanoate synthase [Pseudomonadota bacterium]